MENISYSRPVADVVKNFLIEDGWRFSFDDQVGLFKFGLNLKGRMKHVNYIIKVRNRDYLVYANAPVGAEEDDKNMMDQLAVFLSRANYGLRNGNFEFDVDGEIRYKCFVDYDGGVLPSSEVVRNSILCPAMMFEKYGDGILEIIFLNATAKEAIEKCEKLFAEEIRTLLGKGLDSIFGESLGIGESQLGSDCERSESDV